MTKPISFITGICGQDGSYLAELLLEKGHIVHGLKRRSSSFNTQRIDHLYGNESFHLHYGDLTDSLNIINVIKEIQPDYIFNLGAMSHVGISFTQPEYVANCDGLGALRILEAVKILGLEKKTKILQASTSEMFGGWPGTEPQSENTVFQPNSPYAVAKLFAHHMVGVYRRAYNIWASCAITFNHEGNRRGENFVTRKITMAVAKIANGQNEILELGNLDALRDWGSSKDYVQAFWLMMQQEQPTDLVLATGQQYSVRYFVEQAFNKVGINIHWQGTGIHEVGINPRNDDILVKVNPKYFRPAEVETLLGNPAKSKEVLGWEPTTSIDQLIEEMVHNDIQLVHHKMKLEFEMYTGGRND